VFGKRRLAVAGREAGNRVAVDGELVANALQRGNLPENMLGRHCLNRGFAGETFRQAAKSDGTHDLHSCG